jgi:predicted TPR repeat methyltransferase
MAPSTPASSSSTTSRLSKRPSGGGDRALSVDEALTVALVLHQNEQLSPAAEIYRGILDAVPDHPDALHFSGVLAHQQGRSDDAVALIERSVEHEPERADWHSNLGIVLQDRLDLDGAVRAYRRAIDLDPSHANAYSNVGVLLRAKGELSEAEAAYRAAVAIDPEHSNAYQNLGVLLNAQGRSREAARCFSRVITLRPQDPQARRLLAIAYCTLGEVEKAVAIFEEWLEEEPGSPIARHMLAACSGHEVPARASDDYIRTTFDSFAASFDAKLAKLLYRAPELVVEMLARAGADPGGNLDVLDAGCGTGLCGPLLAPYSRRLVGVDLSERMLAHASERGVYDDLVHAELTGYLAAVDAAFDVIVSADTLVYFGPLEPVAAAAARALLPGGRLVFTVEELPGRGGRAGYAISTSGRYQHRRDYVEHVLADAGFEPDVVPAELRLEAGEPVAGLVVSGTRQRYSGGRAPE